MKLYVVAGERNSQLARENIKNICDEHLKNEHQIEEVDVVTNFESALKDRVFVTPTLILVSPEPKVTIVGNLSDKTKVVAALRLGFEDGK